MSAAVWAQAFALVFDPYVMMVIIASSLFGLFVGAVPGLTATMATALLVPVTFFMPPVPAVAAIVTATAMAIFSGDIPGALLRIPGTPASAAYTDESYAMTLKGQAETALGAGLVFSAIGGLFGTAIMILFSPALAEFALKFSSFEYFWLVVLGLASAVFIGKVPKLNLLRQLHKFDWTAVKELSKLPNFNDDTIQFHMGDFVEAHGVKVLTQREFLVHLFPEIGSLTSRQLTIEEYADIEYGMGVAREIARLDIGQTVVVRDRMIVALEAIEGTDEAIKRAVKLSRGPVVVCKVSKPNQDQRFDVPTVGMSTLRSMLREDGTASGSILVVEAKETLVVDREEMVAFAEKHGIAIVSAPLPEKKS